MDPNAVPVKTDAGRQEIGTRAHKLAWQTRALLVSINGDKTVSELAGLFKTPEALHQAVQELLTLALIGWQRGPVASPEPLVGEGITPLQQARQLLNDTAMGAIGMFGGFSKFRFTLKLERCYSPAELRAIFPEYRSLVAKTKGDAFVDAVLERVEALLAQE
ncbi:MAG: hypothetical protein ABI846_10320 [Rudaea sp.]